MGGVEEKGKKMEEEGSPPLLKELPRPFSVPSVPTTAPVKLLPTLSE